MASKLKCTFPFSSEPVVVIDAIPINRWKLELLLDLKNLSHCFPDKVEVKMGSDTLIAKVSKTQGELVAEVNSSLVQPLDTVPIMVRRIHVLKKNNS